MLNCIKLDGEPVRHERIGLTGEQIVIFSTHKLLSTHKKCNKNALIENMIQVQVLLSQSQQ